MMRAYQGELVLLPSERAGDHDGLKTVQSGEAICYDAEPTSLQTHLR
jgi:hypothetical protein